MAVVHLLSNTPTVTTTSEGVELAYGMAISPSVKGKIVSLRFYKSSSDTRESTVVRLWSSAGVELANVTISHAKGASGWQEANLGASVAVAAGATIHVGATFPSPGVLQYTANGATSKITNGVLSSPAKGGRYRYKSEGAPFPDVTQESNHLFFVDVGFEEEGSGKLLTLEITDSVAIADAITKQTGKAQADALPIADTVVKFTSRPLADSLPIADQVGKAAGKPLSDALPIADSVSKRPGKALADPLPIADAVTKVPGKGVADNLAIADQVTKKTGKALSDQLPIADSIGKKVSRTLADALAIADSIARKVGKALLDLLGLADVLETTAPRHYPPIDEPTGLTIWGGAGLEVAPPAGMTIAADATGLQLGPAAALELGPGAGVVLPPGNTSLRLDPGADLEIDG